MLNDNDDIRIGLAEHGQEIRIRFQLGSEFLTSAVSAIELDSDTLRLPSTAPDKLPHLKIRWPKGNTNYFPIEKEITLVGRAQEADLHIPENFGFVGLKVDDANR